MVIKADIKKKKKGRQEPTNWTRTKKEAEFENLMNYGTNSKLGLRVAGFSLPALTTCTPSDWCRKFCYALKGFYNFPEVKRKYIWAYGESKKDTFVDDVIAELTSHGKMYKVKGVKANKYRWIRVHPSGDFYSVEYADKWRAIAEHFTGRRFVAYTKRGDLKNAMYKLDALDNFTVLESLDPSIPNRVLPKLTFATVVGTQWDADATHECPASCPMCGYKCWYGKSVVFRKIVGLRKKKVA
jgi:hypothetical protein